eukprot:1546522-Rhodomonas_salina.1
MNYRWPHTDTTECIITGMLRTSHAVPHPAGLTSNGTDTIRGHAIDIIEHNILSYNYLAITPGRSERTLARKILRLVLVVFKSGLELSGQWNVLTTHLCTGSPLPPDRARLGALIK